MARTKKGEINKSQEIRDYLSTHKRAKVATVIEALAAKGIEVGKPLVYAVKGKKKNKTQRGGQKTSRPAATSNGHVSLDSLLAAKKLVDTLGGVEQAKAAIDVLAKLA